MKIKIPCNLNTPQFTDLFGEWVNYRKAILKKPLKPFTIQRQLKKLSEWGLDKATKAINNSLDNQWQGLFEPKDHQKKSFTTPDDAYDTFKKQARKEPMNLQPEVREILSGIGRKM